MKLDKAIDRFILDVGKIDNFDYFFPALYDHLLTSASNSMARGFGYENYVDSIAILENDPIEFVRRYEAKNDIIFCIKDEEIIEILTEMTKNSSADFINHKINEFRAWRMKQEIKELTKDLKLDFSKVSEFVSPELIELLNEDSSENNS